MSLPTLSLSMIHHCVRSAELYQFLDIYQMRKGGLVKREKDYLKKLGEHVRKIRVSKGYSQDRLCLEASFSRGTVFKIECGSVNPQILTLARMAEVLEVPLKRLTDIDLSSK